MNIVLIHKGFNDYLEYNIKNLTEKFPNSNLYLIGDNHNKNITNKYKCNFFNIKDYYENFNYYHYSVNEYDYEEFCIQRWFILKNFMKKNNIKFSIYFDSDVLVLDHELIKKYHYDTNYDAILYGYKVCVPFVISFSLNGIEFLTDNIKKFYNLDKT